MAGPLGAWQAGPEIARGAIFPYRRQSMDAIRQLATQAGTRNSQALSLVRRTNPLPAPGRSGVPQALLSSSRRSRSLPTSADWAALRRREFRQSVSFALE